MEDTEELEELRCDECDRPFEEGETIYTNSAYGNDNYFCSLDCVHDWLDEETFPQEYHRKDFEDWLDD